MKSAFVLLIILLAALLAGCAGWRSGRPDTPPRVAAAVGGLPFEQTGAAAVPATAASTTTTTAATIPPGVAVTAAPDGSLTWTTAAPLAVVTTIRADTATGPAAFTPPAPPTPSDAAAGRASLLMRLGLVVGVALGVFGLVRGWDFVACGGGALAAGCVVGLSLAAIPAWLWVVFGIAAAACVLGPVLWHWKLKPTATAAPSPSPLPSPSPAKL